jgi:transcriptional regulator with XRE-family HTH domain
LNTGRSVAGLLMTQAELGAKIGVGQPVISTLEHMRKAQPPWLADLAKVLGVRMPELLIPAGSIDDEEHRRGSHIGHAGITACPGQRAATRVAAGVARAGRSGGSAGLPGTGATR